MKLKNCRIVLGAFASFNERRAAAFLSKYIRIVTGHIPEKVTDDVPAATGEIIVGRTSRPGDASSLRSGGTAWAHVAYMKDGSLYLSGLGLPPAEEPPYNTAYRLMDDGCIGTVLAAYAFVEKALGCDFLNEAYTEYPSDPEIDIPDGFGWEFTSSRLLSLRPENRKGPLLVSLPSGSELNWNMSGSIIKTEHGKLIVIDGGHPGAAEQLVGCIEALWDGEGRPEVSLWLFTHLHNDHYGAILRLLSEPALRDRISVKKFCHHLLSPAFYASEGREKPGATTLEACEALTHFDSYYPGCEVKMLGKGDVLDTDGISFEVLRVPSEADSKLMNYNDTSVVLMMTACGQRWLLLADAEFVASRDLLSLPAGKLRADVVEVGHHGCGNVSKHVYEAAGASASVWHTGPRFLYSESGEGLGTHNTGVVRTRAWLRELGLGTENEHIIIDDLFETPLPMKIIRKD
ncbi:MAG: MBL fold metallo-hydrolase [Clostridia bacterium]|nr:MBL fold metallo-hydrolase [Clostridia bacterium]